MVQVEYRMDDFEPLWQKALVIAAWVFLGLLIPATVLGYFAEKSIPGKTLYPFKRAIESGVLTLESLTPYGKSSYLLALADTRVSETSTLVENAKVSGNYGESLIYSDSALADIVTSVRGAQSSIQQISDPVKKKEAEQNLANSIQKYQNNLQRIVIVIHQPSTTFSSMGQSVTPTPSPVISNTPTPTPPQNSTNVPPDSQNQLAQQIQQTQSDLQSIQNQLTVSPIPTPTLVASPTPTLPPSPTVTSTPQPSFHPHQRNNTVDTNGNNTNAD